MPSPSPVYRSYKPYNGKIFFVVKEELENLGEGDYERLLRNSIAVKVINGKLSAELPPETYLVEVEDVYMYSEENTIIVEQGVVINKDFKFYKCTSY